MSLGMNATYATKRRKRSVKCLKSPLKEPPKSNPSKRHRERLNNELDHLASLLPFDQQVISKLDKLSILRLAVSYLRTKNYFHGVQKDLMDSHMLTHGHHYQELGHMVSSLALEALNGFLIVITSDAEVFYASSTVEQYLGFHQSDIIHQSVLELIHSEDRELFSQQLDWKHNLPEDKKDEDLEDIFASGKMNLFQKTITARFRCLLDNTSGFITLEIAGHLKLINALSLKSKKPTVALFALCTPFGPLPNGDIEGPSQTFKSKHKMDMSPLSMDQRAQLLFGYSDNDLSRISGYQLIHPGDVDYYSSAHKELIKTGTSGLIAYRLQAKDLSWMWLQTSTKIVYKNSKPDFVTCTHRQLSEDEGKELLGKRGSEFKLPYPLQDPEQTVEDCTTKSQKAKKSKSQLREYLHAGRKRRTPYRDPLSGFSVLTNGCDPKADLLYPLNGGVYFDNDDYRSSMYNGCSVDSYVPYRYDFDRSLYNGVYIDPSQYQRANGAAYPDLVAKYSCGKYGVEQVSPYGLNPRRDSNESDVLKYGTSVRYDCYTANKLSDGYSGSDNKTPFYNSAYGADMYMPALPFHVSSFQEQGSADNGDLVPHHSLSSSMCELAKVCQPKAVHTSVIRSTDSRLHGTVYEGTTVQDMGAWTTCSSAYPPSPSSQAQSQVMGSSCQYQGVQNSYLSRSPLNSSGHSSASSSPGSVYNDEFRLSEDRSHLSRGGSSIAVPVVRSTQWVNTAWNDYSSCRQSILKGMDSAAELKVT